MPPQRIGEIVAGKRAVTADTDLRLCRCFVLSDGWWLRNQVAYDTAIAKEAIGPELDKIQRCTRLVAKRRAPSPARRSNTRAGRP